MAGYAPKTRDWKAVENRQPPGVRLYVTGKVETTNSNQTPQLSKAEPQGIIPENLILNLTISTSGVGNDVMGEKEARYQDQIKKGQYASVEIHSEGNKIAQCDVEVIN